MNVITYALESVGLGVCAIGIYVAFIALIARVFPRRQTHRRKS